MIVEIARDPSANCHNCSRPIFRARDPDGEAVLICLECGINTTEGNLKAGGGWQRGNLADEYIDLLKRAVPANQLR